MLGHDDVLSLLLANGLLSSEALLAGPFEIVDASRRNRNFIVRRAGGAGYFAKSGVDVDGRRTVAHEAAFYEFALSDPQCASWRGHLPAKAVSLQDGRVLLLDLLDGATSLREHFTARRTSAVPAVLVAKFLTALHGTVRMSSDGGRFEDALSDRAPFGLTFDQPDRAVLHSCSSAAIELLRIVQGSAVLCQGLTDMRAQWRVECLVHGDVRWDNCLLVRGRNRPRLYVVDWELAVYGDPWWDVGAMLAEHVGFWLQSIPISADDDAEHDLSAAGYPLQKLTQSASAFWATYASACQLDAHARSEALWRTTRYAAARLIQSGFEWANTTSMLSNHSILAVQLAENIILNPRAAAATLFGVVDEPDLA